MVEVFKTNVQKKTESRKLLGILAGHFPACRINFDLSDHDKILRVEGEAIPASRVLLLVRDQGFICEILD